MSKIERSHYTRPHTMSATSPFRYPGGKGFLTDFVQERLSLLNTKVDTYVEPFAGGAGAAMNLLRRGAIENVVLNDLDIRVYSAWRAILKENDRFLELLRNVPVDIASWHRYREIVDIPPDEYSFELGFATFFINRTSRAGILLGSGPIGGYQQKGNWNIEARFYRDTMLRRTKWIGENAGRIEIRRKPAIEFLQKCSRDLPKETTFYFVDPPYVAAGSRLYFNGMSEADHRELAKFLRAGHLENWILTYDNAPIIHELYSENELKYLEVGYSLRQTRNENELLISSV